VKNIFKTVQEHPTKEDSNSFDKGCWKIPSKQNKP